MRALKNKRKGAKKPTGRVDWLTILISAAVDLTVGLLILLIEKITR